MDDGDAICVGGEKSLCHPGHGFLRYHVDETAISLNMGWARLFCARTQPRKHEHGHNKIRIGPSFQPLGWKGSFSKSDVYWLRTLHV